MQYKNLSGRKKFVFYLDIVLFDLFVLSMSPKLTGLPLHEIIGILFLLSILIHVSMEWLWLKSYIRRFFKTSANRDKFNLILNGLLFFSLVFQVISGAVISEVILPNLHIKIPRDYNWLLWHAQIAIVTIFLAGLHLSLSFNKITSYFKKSKASLKERSSSFSINIKIVLLRTSVLVILILLTICMSFLIIGRPSAERSYMNDVVSEFHPTLWPGIFQLITQVFLVVVTCIVSRKWLRVRI